MQGKGPLLNRYAPSILPTRTNLACGSRLSATNATSLLLRFFALTRSSGGEAARDTAPADAARGSRTGLPRRGDYHGRKGDCNVCGKRLGSLFGVSPRKSLGRVSLKA